MLNVSNDPLFEIWDYLVFVFVILGSLAIGAYYACANKTTDEYFLANRKLKVIPVGISLLVTYLSAINILGIPAEIFYFGVELWFFVIGFTFGSFITCATFVPLLHPLKITTINEVRHACWSSYLQLVPVQLYVTMYYYQQKVYSTHVCEKKANTV